MAHYRHCVCHLQGNEVWLVKLAGVDSPEDADALRGHALLVRADERPPLEDDDEFYVQVGRQSCTSPHALLGCRQAVGDLLGMVVMTSGVVYRSLSAWQS